MRRRDSTFQLVLRELISIANEFGRSSCLFLVAVFAIQSNFQDAGAVATFHQQDLHGEVEAGNYSYYHLKNDFNDGSTPKTAAVVLLLFSIEGDADLYVSRSVDRPTFEHGHHDFQSTSCGIDRLDINLNAPITNSGWSQNTKPGAASKAKQAYPLTVGVYGHPSRPLSRYLLKVLLFVEETPVPSGQSNNWRFRDDEYMSDEMLSLASANRWRDWVQMIEDDFSDVADAAAFSDSATQGQSGEGFVQMLKALAEIVLAILSFTLNILVEIMV